MPELCTVADVRSMLVVRPGGAVDAGLLQLLVEGVSTAMLNVISRPIFSTDYTETRNGTGTGKLVLKNTPVTAVASVSVGLPATRALLTYGTEYVWSEASIQLLAGIFDQRPAWVAVAYTAGFVEVPADLRTAAAKTAALRYRQLERLGQESKTLAGETVTFDNESYPKDVMDVLVQYQRKAPI